ncbi:MAG TPA: hypothetical protein VFR36_09750 [Sphingomicrobium sp.]|nr:hypothetical protein [Sphingomicrobium sp.]
MGSNPTLSAIADVPQSGAVAMAWGWARDRRVRAGAARSAAETTERSEGNPTLSAIVEASSTAGGSINRT